MTVPVFVPFSDLYDQVLPYLPGAEPPLVDSQIRKALREFMRRTTISREIFEWDTAAIPTPTYHLIPSYGEVSSIIGVWLMENGSAKPLPPVPEDRRVLREPGRPEGWYTTALDYVTLHPQPDGVYPMRAEAVVTLAQDSTHFPDYILRHHAEAICAGVLSLMYGMPGKPWTQAQSAAQAGRAFAGEIRTLRGSLRDGGQPNQSTFIAARKFGA
jgi:hypothetical protein